jgi:hypothetical protein
MMEKKTSILNVPPIPNLIDYEAFSKSFRWEDERQFLNGLPGGNGLNMAYEAVGRQAEGNNKDTTEFRLLWSMAWMFWQLNRHQRKPLTKSGRPENLSSFLQYLPLPGPLDV